MNTLKKGLKNVEIKIDENYKDQRLDNFSKDFFFEEYFFITGESLTRTKVQKYIEQNKIKVNNSPSKSSYKLRLNDIVDFEIKKEENELIIKPKNIPLDIYYEDDDLIVLNKQKNLLCHPTSKNEENTLVNALLYHTKNLSDVRGKIRQGIVHRLDKDTSGLMLVAKTNEAHLKLQEDIKTKKTIRKYLAVCYGTIKEDEGKIEKPLVHYLDKTVKMNTAQEGLYALTKYRVIERFENATFLELKLETGRTHQIRCHLSSIGHPVINDDLYGAKGYKLGIFKNLKTTRQILMSYYLSFTHPKTNEIMEFEIEKENYHPDLIKVLKLLRS